jgi:hypothetical protein
LVLRERRRIGLEPDGREIRVDALYGMPWRPALRGSLQAASFLRLEPHHDASAPIDLGLGLHYHLRF